MTTGLAVLGLCAATSIQSDATSADIAARHVQALGGIEAIHAIHAYIQHGWYVAGSFRTDHADIVKMRPFYRVIGSLTDPLDDIHEGYDGGAWEFYPDPGIVVRTVGSAAAATRHGAMFDDPLVDHESEGTRLQYLGKRTLDGQERLIVRTTLTDGFQQDIAIDPASYLIYSIERVVPMHAFGKRYHTHNVFSDYRPEGGVMWPHLVKEIDSDTGKALTENGVKSVEINPVIPRSVFSPPDWKRTPVQEMIQRIYDERDEPASVMATYHQFRAWIDVKASPTVDAVDFVGYQCLKMGEVKSAVALLTANVADNRDSARAHFGLGRALQASGNKGEATEQYKEALKIDPHYERATTALQELSKS